MRQRKIFMCGGLILCILCVVWFVCPQQSSAAAGKEKVRVLALLPLTGPCAPHGKYLLHGFEMFQKDFPDSNVLLSVQDSQSNPKTAMSILAQEIARKRPSIVISAMSHVSKPVIIKTDDENIFTFLVLSTSERIIHGHSNVQRIFPPTADNIGPIALYAREKFPSLSILYSNEEFGISNKEKLVSLYSNEKNIVLQTIAYSPGDKDVRTLVLKAISNNPSAIYVAGFDSTYVGLLKTIRELGFTGAVLTDSGFCNPSIQNAIGEAAEGIVFTGTEADLSNPRTPSVREFAERYQKQYGRDAMHFTAVTYDTLALIDHIARSGKPFSQETLESLMSWQGIAFETQFLPEGECAIPLFMILYQGGERVVLE